MKLGKEDDHQEKYDPNAPETEEDGLIAGQLRIQKILFRRKEMKERTQNLLKSQNDDSIHVKDDILGGSELEIRMTPKKEDNHQEKYDPNAPETEEDGLIAGQLRIHKILFRRKEMKERSQNLLQLQNDGSIHEKDDIIEVSELKNKPKSKKFKI